MMYFSLQIFVLFIFSIRHNLTPCLAPFVTNKTSTTHICIKHITIACAHFCGRSDSITVIISSKSKVNSTLSHTHTQIHFLVVFCPICHKRFFSFRSYTDRILSIISLTLWFFLNCLWWKMEQIAIRTSNTTSTSVLWSRPSLLSNRLPKSWLCIWSHHAANITTTTGLYQFDRFNCHKPLVCLLTATIECNNS